MTILDDFDLRLIDALQDDGTQTQRALGQRLGASEATVRRRLHRIVKQDAIRICGIPNLSALGYDLLALIGLRLDLQSHHEVISSLINQPRVLYLASCTGRFHVMLACASRSRKELASFLIELTDTHGVLWVETFVTLHVYKNRVWSVDDAERQVDSKTVTFKDC